jgi:hypothetical protein
MSGTPRLKFRKEFDWSLVAWGRPDSPPRELCSYCHGALPDVPLMLWREDGSAMSLCDTCSAAWITTEIN